MLIIDGLPTTFDMYPQDLVNALSIIKTSIKRNNNPYDTIKSIFNNEVLFAN